MSIEYDRYLVKHKQNVAKGFEWIRDNLPELLMEDGNYEHNCCFAHDASKSAKDEYEAYDAYFYGGNRSYQVVQDYNIAWLKHIHRNPHHWQYWVLIHDDPDEPETILDMPYEYIIEMICDWWSFSWQEGDLFEIFDWYGERRHYIKLSDKTRLYVEGILSAIWEKLFDLDDEDSDELAHHGIKGQRWGVKNGPPYPIKKNKVANSLDDGTIDDIYIHRSVGAKSLNYDVLDPATGEYYHFVEGTRIRNAKVFAGKGGVKPLRDEVKEGLSEQIGGKPQNWQHCKGEGTLNYKGEPVDAEVHWFQEETVGKHRFKIKEWHW